MIETRPVAECEFDIVALGEVMLRLDPGEGRIRTARRFEPWEGGGEYNVARGLSKVFGLRAGVFTALVDNEVGRLVENLILQGGVDASLIRWEIFDGIGRLARNGLNFTERGFGVRAAVGVSDRAGTAISNLSPGTVDWDELFGRRGVRWLHTGGIFAGLSERSAAVAEEAMVAAHRHSTVVSYDTNYRPSLWVGNGGAEHARDVNTRLARHVDVIIGNQRDFRAVIGVEVDDAGERQARDGFTAMADAVAEKMPWLSVVASTLRTVRTASDNDWQTIGWSPDTGVLTSVARDHLAIFDRVGGGDGFASGLIYGLLQGEELQQCLEFGAAHGALAMTTPGDNSMATLEEVQTLAAGGSARARR